MKKTKNPINSILDSKNTDNIILYNEKGEPIEFEQIAVIPINNEIFVILKPCDESCNELDNEAYAFEIIQKNGEDILELVEDSDQIKQIFDRYDELYEKNVKK